MEYVIGSIADLISGNVTPSRPKNLKRALTPVKHQPSPNVTPKSEYVEDRSIFLSPTMQKKKAIVKKSPKRIFQNTDLDVTNDGESASSPNTDKVKKHLKDDLENVPLHNVSVSPKSKNIKKNNALENLVQEPETEANEFKKKKRKSLVVESNCNETEEANQDKQNLMTSKKSKKNKVVELVTECVNKTEKSAELEPEEILKVSCGDQLTQKSKKKEKLYIEHGEMGTSQSDLNISKKKKKKDKSGITNIDQSVSADHLNVAIDDSEASQAHSGIPKKKKKKAKENKDLENNSLDIKESKKKKKRDKLSLETNDLSTSQSINDQKKKKSKHNSEEESYDVNPNAVTNQDTDSEHESDDEMPSENEEVDKKALEVDPSESSDNDEVATEKSDKEKVSKQATAEEIKRTLFVGNVPLSKKCKKEIKKIFSEYGRIETVRIRTVPVKDARMTPKMAVIKNELHPDRSTVNIYIRYADADSVDKALSANNMVLNDHHLRVSRSDVTGAYHDPKCSIFVGNLPFALEDEGLRAKFEKCGEIHSVRIIRDKKTNAGKGFGYVNFSSKDGVELALALTDEDLTIKNRILRVKRCTITNQKLQRPDNRSNTQRPNSQNRTQRPYSQNNSQRPNNWNNAQRPDNRHNNGPQRNNLSRSNQGVNNEGAYRRIMNKRKNMGDSGGPPNKRQRDLNQPHKEKKARKEFVGLTAEKKKKQKFSKGQKKKKALSEILTKK